MKKLSDKLKRTPYLMASVKEAISQQEVQDALAKHLEVSNPVILKEVKKPYKNPDTGITTQKIEAVSGTSLQDMVKVNFTLVGTEMDAVTSINKEYRLVDYTFALEANMKGGQFAGYSATGFKLMVTKIEEVKGDTNEEPEN